MFEVLACTLHHGKDGSKGEWQVVIEKVRNEQFLIKPFHIKLI